MREYTAKKATRKIVRDSIYNEVLDKIQYCEWAPGTLIGESTLAEMFQVSRSPVREALSLLSRDGFVDIYPQSGSYVSKIDVKRIREIQYLRYHVEKPILLELAEKRPVIPETIEKALLLEEFAAKKGNWAECVQLDYSIHEELMTMANHREIWNIIRPELAHYTRIRFFESSFTEFTGEEPRTLAEHRDIVAAIAEGDAQRLTNALAMHYNHLIAISDKYKVDPVHNYRFDRIHQYPEYFTNLEALE